MRAELQRCLARVRPEHPCDIERTGADLAVVLEQYEAELKVAGLGAFPMRVELAIEKSLAMEPAGLVLLAGISLGGAG
jgi:hypothetical protein